MAFIEALILVKELEGGRSQNPDDPGGDTLDGITQKTWAEFDFPGSVLDASQADIAAVYRKLWDEVRIENPETQTRSSLFEVLPAPADAVAFQMHINLPWRASIVILQTAIGATPDGVLGPEVWHKLQHWNGWGEELSNLLLLAQVDHYNKTAKPEFLRGLLNRVTKVRAWLARRD